jgi:hypothetical protein
MRRRILESAVLEALWLGPLFGAPVSLALTMQRGGPVVPWLLVVLAILIGARRALGRNLTPLLAVAGAAEAWALWASSSHPGDELAEGLSSTMLTSAVAWVFLPALARSLEPIDTLEAHFPRTVLADATTILAAVSFAVLFDIHAALGLVAAVLAALALRATSILRVRVGLAIVGGALLHVWLGLDAAVASAQLDPRRGALTTAAMMIGVVALARSEPRPERSDERA